MARILVFLMILVVTNQVSSFDIFGISFEDIKEVFDYALTLYKKGMEIVDSTKEVTTNKDSGSELQEVMSELKEISKQLANFESRQDEKMDAIVKKLLNDLEVIGDFQSAKTDFNHYISNVEIKFEEAIKYHEKTGYNDETKKHFIDSVLYDNGNLDHTLSEIYKLIIPAENNIIRKSLMTLALETTEAGYERLCNKFISPQQWSHYVFMLLIQIQLKGFTTISQAYCMQSVMYNVSHTQEYNEFYETFIQRLTAYFQAFIDFMASFPADIRRCDVQNPKIGENALEMEGLFQVLVNYEYNIRGTIKGGCEDTKNPSPSKFILYNCRSYVNIRGCPTTALSQGALRTRFSWFYADSQLFGHSNLCQFKLFGIAEYRDYFHDNDACVCSVNLTEISDASNPQYRTAEIDTPKVIRISTEPQMSDVANNMVVVGVQFIIYDDTIHLQIKQSKIGKGGTIMGESKWKPVNKDNDDKKIQIETRNLYDKRSIFHLDDVMAHPNYVVTGVKFQVNSDNTGFELHVHSTQYDYKKEILGKKQKWFAPGEHPRNYLDYERKRIEIILNDPDDPSMAHDYHPDPNSNKFIQLQHSSIKKDAGFHTVPFFDAQPVEVSPEFPLGGIGLFHRGRNGFGGYIAPRIFTHNIAAVIESSFEEWKKVLDLYKTCGLELPKDPAAIKENLNCKVLQSSLNSIEDGNSKKS
ncbi:hypothetical protein PV327_009759 [Microctonus hyperodae]|uniref:Uncharacterized protein n=1 Tax=Microctonus hyperodae TaxID=165561 RepID=A0AA39CB45_MICHY|nr:hypothetical protein PV327_009759 [Microctonus hyperodae]